MSKINITTSIDIGTNSIKIFCVANKPSSSGLEVLAQIQENVLGVRKGVVADVESVSQKITSMLAQVEDRIGQKINNVYVNINGSHIFVTPSRGTVVVSRADQKISREDIDRVVQSAQAIPLRPNNEILDVFTKEFIVDGVKGIKDPTDMQGVKIEVEILALCGFSPYLKNLTSAVLNSGVGILEITFSPLASAESILTPQQKELGVCLIDIGAGTTSVAVYKEGNLIHTAVLPIGSWNITRDIATGLKIEIDLAEKIKKEYGNCVLAKNNNSKKEKEIRIELLEETAPLIFSRKMLVGIIESRASEIFGLVARGLKDAVSAQEFPVSIILTGGGSKLRGIAEIATKRLKLHAKIGRLNEKYTGLDQDICFSTACGLILASKEMGGGLNPPIGGGGGGFINNLVGIFRKIFSKLKKLFKIFIP